MKGDWSKPGEEGKEGCFMQKEECVQRMVPPSKGLVRVQRAGGRLP